MTLMKENRDIGTALLDMRVHVNKFLARGWTPLGGVSITYVIYEDDSRVYLVVQALTTMQYSRRTGEGVRDDEL